MAPHFSINTMTNQFVFDDCFFNFGRINFAVNFEYLISFCMRRTTFCKKPISFFNEKLNFCPPLFLRYLRKTFSFFLWRILSFLVAQNLIIYLFPEFCLKCRREKEVNSQWVGSINRPCVVNVYRPFLYLPNFKSTKDLLWND